LIVIGDPLREPVSDRDLAGGANLPLLPIIAIAEYGSGIEERQRVIMASGCSALSGSPPAALRPPSLRQCRSSAAAPSNGSSSRMSKAISITGLTPLHHRCSY